MSKTESYKTTVRYYSCRTKQEQKYITIELPADSSFNIDERVEISITQSPKIEYTTTIVDENTKRLTPGAIMSQMDIGESATFNVSQWGNLRSIASQIKDMYGAVFTVKRSKKRPENVIVKRVF